MKRTLSTMLIAGALIIAGLNACTKQDYAPVPSTQPPTAEQAKLNTVAASWVNDGTGIYRSTLANILSNLSIAHSSSVSVYMQENGTSTLISGPASVTYKNHPIWATITRNDVVINYSSPEGPMPFQILHIEVVIN